MLHFFKKYLLWYYVFLLLVHFGFKDHFYLTGFFFYSFPLPFLILVSVLLVWLYYRHKVIRLTIFTTTCFLSIFWIKNYHKSHTTKDLSNTSSILLWNVAKQEDYNIKVLKEILDNNTINALFFVEAIHENNEFNKVFEKELKEYNIQYLKGNMMIASSSHIKPIWYYEKNSTLRFNHIKVEIDSTTFNIGLVDILNNLNKIPKSLNKKEALNTIINYAEENHLDIVLGDFNTPYESVNFEKFQNNYNSAREFQNGFTGTWPSILPLFEIDQVWISKKREILKTEKYYFDNSDHAMLITYFTQKVD